VTAARQRQGGFGRRRGVCPVVPRVSAPAVRPVAHREALLVSGMRRVLLLRPGYQARSFPALLSLLLQRRLSR
jgi:hypothetical protein